MRAIQRIENHRAADRLESAHIAQSTKSDQVTRLVKALRRD